MVAHRKEMLLVLLLMAVALAFANPGVKIRVTEKGIQYANREAEAALGRALRAVYIPNQSDGGRFSWEINNIRFPSIRGPNTQIQLNPGTNGLNLRVSNFGVNVRADWRVQYRLLFRIRSSGSVELNFNGASFSATIRVGNLNGRPSLYATACNFDAGNIGVRLRGGLVAWILNLFRGTVRNRIRDMLQTEACKKVIEKINEANGKLGYLQTLVNLGPKFQLDYSLVGNPQVTGRFLETNHKGVVYWRGANQDSPVPRPVFPPLTDVSKMLYVVLTDYTFNTFAYQAHRNNFLTYNIGLDNISPNLAYLLSPTSQIAARYPNSTLQLRISSAQAPVVTTQEGQLTLSALGNVDVIVTAPGSNPENILTLGVNASVIAQPNVSSGRLSARIGRQSYFYVDVRRSTVGPSNDVTEFSTKLNEVFQKIVIPGLNYVGNLGLDLPVTGNVHLIRPQLDVRRGGVIVSTDVVLI